MRTLNDHWYDAWLGSQRAAQRGLINAVAGVKHPNHMVCWRIVNPIVLSARHNMLQGLKEDDCRVVSEILS